MRRFTLVFLILCSLASFCHAAQVTEEHLGSMPHWTIRTPQDIALCKNMGNDITRMAADLQACFTTPYGRHVVAVVAKQNDQCAMWQDGSEGPTFQQIRHIVRGAYDDKNIAFTPDGSRVAYEGKTGKGWVMVVDGKPGPVFYDIDNITYSQNSKHFAYMGVVKDGIAVPVIDGKVGPTVQLMPSWYVPTMAGDPSWPDATPNGRIAFSPDGSRVAYLLRKKRDANGYDNSAVVLDGKEGPVYTGITAGAFSRDSRHFAYVAMKNEQYCVIVDGKQGPLFNGVIDTTVTFSPDGTHVAYVVATDDGNGSRVVCDGKLGPVFETIDDTSLTFSHDSKHLAYAASQQDKFFIVLDGKPGPRYDQVGNSYGSQTLYAVFNPLNNQLSYQAKKGEKYVMVIGGKESPAYDEIGNALPVISPDGKHIAYAVKKADYRWAVVNDGVESPVYDNVTWNSLRYSDDGRLSFQARTLDSRGNFIAVINGHDMRNYTCSSDITFSHNGQHYAYFGSDGDYAGLVVDGAVVVRCTEIAQFGSHGPVIDDDGTIRLVGVRKHNTGDRIISDIYRFTVKL